MSSVIDDNPFDELPLQPPAPPAPGSAGPAGRRCSNTELRLRRPVRDATTNLRQRTESRPGFPVAACKPAIYLALRTYTMQIPTRTPLLDGNAHPDWRYTW